MERRRRRDAAGCRLLATTLGALPAGGSRGQRRVRRGHGCDKSIGWPSV